MCPHMSLLLISSLEKEAQMARAEFPGTKAEACRDPVTRSLT